MTILCPKPILKYNTEIRADFNEKKHLYTDKFGTQYKSVSALIKSFFPFSKSIQVSPEVIKQACIYGTFIHLKCENYFLHGTEEYYEEYAGIYDYLAEIRDTVIGSEVRLYDPELRLAGTLDCLCNEDGKFIIRDFKTNKSLKYDNGFAQHPLSDIPHTPINGYFLQMSVYAYLLKKLFNIEVSRIEIVHFLRPDDFYRDYRVEVHKSPVQWEWVERALPYFCLQPIICDTREQLPLPFDIPHIDRKLEVGDYSSEYLEDKFCIDRKGADLYSSLITDHDRFKKELIRAQEKGIEIEICCEFSKKVFFSKSWSNKARHLKAPAKTLAKIMDTMSEKYDTKFLFFENRKELRNYVLDKLVERTRFYKKLEK